MPKTFPKFKNPAQVQRRLPYLWLSDKRPRKEGKRAITMCSDTITAFLHSVLAACLSTAYNELSREDHDNFCKKGYRAFIAVRSSHVAAREINGDFPLNNFHGRVPLRCKDVQKCYDSLPHSDVIRRVSSMVVLAFRFAAKRLGVHVRNVVLSLETKKHKCYSTFIQRRQPMQDWEMNGDSGRLFPLRAVLNFLRFGVRNNYVGVKVRDVWCLSRQICGIFQGAASSPDITNLYLAHFEWFHIHSLYNSPHNRHKAYAFVHTYRKIDDICSVNNPYFDSLTYHPSLVVNDEFDVHADTVTFAGMRLTALDNGRVMTRIFDRSVTMPFRAVKYFHSTSLLPPHCIRGVVTGRCHDFMRKCSDATSFLQAVTAFLWVATNQRKHNLHVMRSVAHRFIYTYASHKFHMPAVRMVRMLKHLYASANEKQIQMWLG
jgi:hypothetical protein